MHAFLVLFLGYIGIVVGGAKGSGSSPRTSSRPSGTPNSSTSTRSSTRSVIIDGRIADICETGFLDGTLVVPQFVLHELQQVADSADSLKRNRGRRGLDVLQRIQKMSDVEVQIVGDDFPDVREVDLKLIELARSARAARS